MVWSHCGMGGVLHLGPAQEGVEGVLIELGGESVLLKLFGDGVLLEVDGEGVLHCTPRANPPRGSSRPSSPATVMPYIPPPPS